jgi:hypothetical protein
MAQIKCGVLTFGYDDAPLFRDTLDSKGYYSINLGDNAQSIAIRHAYRQLGFPEDLLVSINRDTLSSYRGGPAYLIMNGVFGPASFPLPPNILPIFVGFHADESVIRQHVEIFRRFQPIGCRDDATTALLQSLGIQARTTGCLTLTLPKRSVAPTEPKLLVVYGTMKGRLPGSILRYIPAELADAAEFIFHRLPMTNFPPSERQRAEAEKYELALLDHFRDEATLVLTPLHHVASPCMAMGIPVIVCRRKPDPRFSFLETLIPIYLPKEFKRIDWNPAAPDLTSIKSNLLSWTREKIEAATVAA